MNTPTLRGSAAAFVLLAVLAGCASARPAEQSTVAVSTPAAAPAPAATPPSASATAPSTATATTAAVADPMAGHAHHMTGMPPVTIPKGALYTLADVQFMQGMIAHHAQAIHMSKLAVTRGANARLLRFAKKIDQSQDAEIAQMQGWLRANGQVAPDTGSWRTIHMQGMLTPEQLAKLDGARGAEFDRQYLILMIQHHEGAIKMVADLFATPLAGQDVDISVFANDVENVQTAEIALMKQMLAEF